MAKLSASRTVGAAPLRVTFSADGSFDHDVTDSLSYQWQFTSTSKPVRGKAPAFTFTKPGTYPVKLNVSDGRGGRSVQELTIRVGNEPPKVTIDVAGNRSFYFSNQPVAYRVQVQDREDGQLGGAFTQQQVRVTSRYLSEGYDFAGLDASGDAQSRGQRLLKGSDCMACHAKEKQSAGPSLLAISQRYDTSATSQLAGKIIAGGGESGAVNT